MSSEEQRCGSITLIVGCMFAGKTTTLMAMAEKHENVGMPIFVINHASDDRYGADDKLYTHSSKSRSCVKLEHLFSATHNADFQAARAIFIDEGQFFDDLATFITMCAEQLGKHVYVSALASNYNRQCFPEVAKAFALADEVIKVNAFCARCPSHTPALFSLKLNPNAPDIGGADTYIPVCRKHYTHKHNSLQC